MTTDINISDQNYFWLEQYKLELSDKMAVLTDEYMLGKKYSLEYYNNSNAFFQYIEKELMETGKFTRVSVYFSPNVLNLSYNAMITMTFHGTEQLTSLRYSF
jgi:hypothetical protein